MTMNRLEQPGKADIDQQFDIKDEEGRMDIGLEKVEGLTWLPWIGNKYSLRDNRILVLGESHYQHGGYTCHEIEGNQNYTRDVISEYVEMGRDAGKQYTMYEPIERILKGSVLDADASREIIWNSVAYMNIIQRVLAEKSGNKDWNWFLDGWKAVLGVVYVLRPRIVICFSTDKQLNRVNFNRLPEFKDEMTFGYTVLKNDDSCRKIGRVTVATPGGIAFGGAGDPIPVVFIQHASRIRRFDEWRSVLQNSLTERIEGRFRTQGGSEHSKKVLVGGESYE